MTLRTHIRTSCHSVGQCGAQFDVAAAATATRVVATVGADRVAATVVVVVARVVAAVGAACVVVVVAAAAAAAVIVSAIEIRHGIVRCIK